MKVTTITGTVNQQGGTGQINNVATVIPNKPWLDAHPDESGIPTNQVTSKYGNIEVDKYDPADSNATAAMAGAVFQVFADPTPGDGVCSAAGTAPAVAIQRVANQKANLGNQLPLTGGNGIAALSLGGLLLIGGGVAYYAATSRKRRQQA